MTRENESVENEYELAISHLQELGIKVLAIDFDLTIVNTHTGGRWKDTSIALAEHVRPVFKHLIPLADESGMLISVVTFSRQVSLIRKVLQQSMEGDNEFVKSMPIEGRIPPHYNTVGKQPHITDVIKTFEKTYPGLELSSSSVLLIDDDRNNIRLAEIQGYKSILFDPKYPEDLLTDMMNL